jgi:hypothetical protein
MADVLEAIRQKGSSPQLETFARDADKVLSAKYPLTGALGTMQDIAPGGKYLGPAWAHASNTVPFLKSLALGGIAQRGPAIGTSASVPRSSVALRTLYQALQDRTAEMSPAYAAYEDER